MAHAQAKSIWDPQIVTRAPRAVEQGGFEFDARDVVGVVGQLPAKIRECEREIALYLDEWRLDPDRVQAGIARGMQLDFNHGDLLLVGGAFTWALYTVLLRWRPAGIDTLAFLGAAVVGGLVLLMLPLYLVELASGRVAVWNAGTGAGMVYFAVFPSILSYLFWNRGVQQVGANRAGLFLYLVPVFGIVLAITFLGERLHLFHLAGAASIFTGIYISTADASGAKGHR